MHTYSLADYMRHIEAGRWNLVGKMLLSSAEKLREAGAELLICPDNTAHQALDIVRDHSPLPTLDSTRILARAALRGAVRQ
jgi:aspartate racemase